jgi:hypothetical protein
MMKKVVAIFLVMLMMTAMIRVVVAEHYCHGSLAASKISLSGKTASCGMEDDVTAFPFSGIQIRNHCCEDIVHYYGIYTTYTPSFSFISDSFQNIIQLFAAPVGLQVNPYSFRKILYTCSGPPDELMSTRVDLSDICVFRI